MLGGGGVGGGGGQTMGDLEGEAPASVAETSHIILQHPEAS